MIDLADGLGLLIGVVGIATVADRIRIAYPILMVMVGLGVALIPIHHQVELPPDLILLVFLPPLIYDASLETSIQEIRSQFRPILLLAVGLVIATMSAVAVVIHAIVPGTSWAVAFTLGAVVSPPDSVAATQIAGKLGLPRHLTTILGGEGMMNDATALTAYQLAVLAVATGFTLTDVVGRFALAVVVGVLPFAAYLPANELKGSGVLAVMAAGLYFGRYGSSSLTPAARLQQHQIWDLIVFLLTGISFLLVGLELRPVLDSLTNRESGSLVLESLAVVGVVIVVRMVWIFGASLLPGRFRLLGRPRRAWRQSTVVGWAGMRGSVSLAAALALPNSFPARDLVVFLTFAVIVATLVGQGLTLPFLIRKLGVASPGHQDTVAVLQTRRRLTLAAIRSIDELRSTGDFPEDMVDRLHLGYEFQLSRVERRLRAFDPEPDPEVVAFDEERGDVPDGAGSGEATATTDSQDNDPEAQFRKEQALRQLVIETERAELDRLVRRGRITQRVATSVRGELDVDETTMRPGTR